jgi:hypothetical protein
VFSQGNRRESLVDLQADPGETKDLARDPNYRQVLLEHRALLTKFARAHNDPLAASLLADDVPPRPFTAGAVPDSQGDAGKKGARRQKAGVKP